MELINQTPFEFALSPWEADPKSWRLTFVVKGTFDLVPEGEATLAEEQLPPTGDEPFADVDDDCPESIRYPSDFPFGKPCADVVVVGRCHAPGGVPVDMCVVSFRVGSLAKAAIVFGGRYWSHKLGVMAVPTEPEPFTEMELRYENSFGGSAYKPNPIGKGLGKVEGEDGTSRRPLPNIENPGDLVSSPGHRPEPWGFGPLHAGWPQRCKKVGKFGKKWLAERWPCLPDDFDWTYFNAAPADQQMEGYLRGDEELAFENLRPEHSQYRTRLPGLRARCFVRRRHPGDSEAAALEEVPMNLDTLWADLEAEQVVLVWRGNIPVASEDFEDIQDTLLISEQLATTPRSLSACEDILRRALEEEGEEFHEEAAPASTSDEEETSRVLADMDAEMAKSEKQLRATLVEAGLDPDQTIEQATAKAREEEKALLEKYGIEAGEEEPPITREDVLAAVAAGASLEDRDLRGLDLSRASLPGAQLARAILEGVNLSGADLSGAHLEGASLCGADFSHARLRKASLLDADLTQATLTEADLGEANLQDTALERVRAPGVILEGATGEGAIFVEADLKGARAGGSRLIQTDFTRAVLDRADFQQAVLDESLFDGARGAEVNMLCASLVDASFTEGCEMPGASFHQVSAKGSVWEKSILPQADFRAAQLEGADFTGARLDGANLDAVEARFGQFVGASMKGTLMRAANLFQGSLEKADLTGADLSGSNLYGVELLEAVTDGAELRLANLKMTKLAG